MAPDDLGRDSDAGLAVRAAWLHYIGGLRQVDVAERLGVSSIKAHRLIARAHQEGAVKFTIDGEIAECAELETRICAKFGLSYCEVVPEIEEDGSPIQALGIAGAKYLRREIVNGNHEFIGLGHGRTLSACVQQLPKTNGHDVQFVSLLGGLTRNFSANPHDVMHHLAAKTGAAAYFMPVPFFVNSADDITVMLAQRGVADVRRMAARSSLKLIGIGTTELGAQIVSSGMVEPEEIREAKARGGVGEILGYFFDEHGANVETHLTSRTVSVDLADLKSSKNVAVAGGAEKARAIGSILMSDYLSGLITDERTATTLMAL